MKHEQSDNNTVYKKEDRAETISKFIEEVPNKAIFTSQIKEWTLPGAPNQVPTNYEDMSPSKMPTEKRSIYCVTSNRQKPDQQTNIFIPHKYTDKPEGDDFGAQLCTYIEHLEYGKIYYRHFFEKVEPHQPASDMRIQVDDELVLLHGVFVPAMPHMNMLNLFRHVKVDGKTRFSLIIRRKLTKQKWEWIETNAVLSPKKRKVSPAVADLKYEELEGDKTDYRPMSKHLYKVSGTDKYIDICDGKARIGFMNDGSNKTKIIWKHPRFLQVDTEGHIDFATTLCDLTKKWYIAIDQKDQIVVTNCIWDMT
ncbi:uncharacterized protein LOC123555504 isoform X2 [Mercenaria mercenaria]|uniref:uncharacterized protein LOC123555504 isoform X2 n=1 Tax=Mercenaria mercenaria TaxID=6596 RepID=UPI00234F2662|nr:uncharacterized protein LOC123555504 isoform X2 [Mercenaria mercenaria]